MYRFSVCGFFWGISHGVISSLLVPVILELHGEHRIELVFGLELMCYGAAAFSGPPLAGEIL